MKGSSCLYIREELIYLISDKENIKKKSSKELAYKINMDMLKIEKMTDSINEQNQGEIKIYENSYKYAWQFKAILS